MATKGNIGLYERYREAWGRINRAIEQGFHFEAIAIEESILSNRILSFLYGVKEVNDEEADGKPFLTLGRLVTRWQEHIKSDARWEDATELVKRVVAWRKCRNRALHSLAMSFPGRAPKVDLAAFLDDVRGTAHDGKNLAREVTKWQERQLTRAKKLLRLSGK